MKTLQPREGYQAQSVTAKVAYVMELGWLESEATDITVTAYDEDGEDVTATTITGAATTPTDTTIKLPFFKAESEQLYKLQVDFTDSGNGEPYTRWVYIVAVAD